MPGRKRRAAVHNRSGPFVSVWSILCFPLPPLFLVLGLSLARPLTLPLTLLEGGVLVPRAAKRRMSMRGASKYPINQLLEPILLITERIVQASLERFH